MKIIIKENIGFNDIKFGELRSQVRTLFGNIEEVQSFLRSMYSEIPSDHYENSGVFFEYDQSDTLEAVEFANCGSVVNFQGFDLFGTSTKNVIAFLKEIDKNLIVDQDGFTSREFGIGGYIGGDPEISNEKFQSIIIFRKGYYDR